MKKTLPLILFLFNAHFSFSQTPGIKWTNYYPAGYDQVFYDIKAASDGGFIIAGSDASGWYDKNRFLNKTTDGRLWLMKADKDGNELWRQPIGGFADSACFTSVEVTSDDNIIVAGYRASMLYSWAVTYYIAKYDNSGVEIWNKTYGGSNGISRAFSVKQTSDGGYLVAGNTNASNGDVVGNHNLGTSDVWLLKLDGSGNIQWKKCYGGSGQDSAFAVVETPDNGFVVAGSSTSTNGDLTGNNGLTDAWVFKISSIGNIIWRRNIGGSSDEDFKAITLNSDSSFTLTGYTASSTITSNGNHGKKDLWLIKLSKTGLTQWSKSFGGSQDEQGYSIQHTIGNGYLIGGYTESANGDITNNNGGADAWMLNLTSNGNLIWQKTIGSNKDEFGMTALYLSETDFAIAGFAQPTTPVDTWDYTDAFLSRLGNINTIKGLLFYDVNLNGIKDPTETGFNNALVTTTKSGFQKSTIPLNGLFNLAVDTGSYSTSVQINIPYYNSVPASINSSFASYFNTDSISFAIQPIPGIRDLTISMVPLTVARLGRSDVYKIYYKNTGTDIINSGEIIFKHDNRLNFLSSIPAISSSNGDTLRWGYSNLNPLDTASITIYMQVQTPVAVNLGDTLSSLAIINPITGDMTPNDNTVKVKQIVIAGYDPNDKYESNEGIIDPSYITNDKYLNYLIRFQNVGNDTAFNVIVRDTLDSKLDWNTFEMVAASHSYDVSITNQNKIEWKFTDIQLPDSNINEPASHGFVAYRIKPKSTVMVGDTIHNNASIYFDFNLPVKTNNAFTVIESFVVLPLKLLSFTGVYQNDQADLHWTTADEINIGKFEIQRSFNGRDFSSVGQVLPRGNINSPTQYDFTDHLNNVQGNTFFYRLMIRDVDSKVAYSRVLLFQRNAAINSLSINPNPVKGTAMVNLNYSRQAAVEFRVVDMSGKIILKQKKMISQGNNAISITGMEKLQRGFYVLQAIIDKEKLTAAFVVQ